MEAQSERRLSELLIYVCRRSEGDDWFGPTKLDELLFFIDLEAFKTHGTSITGQEYVKQQHGLVPKGISSAMEALQTSKPPSLSMRKGLNGLHREKRPIALRGADLNSLTAREISLVDQVLEYYRPMTARQCSDLARAMLGWQLAEMGETIPFGAHLLSDRELRPNEVDYARSLAAIPEVREFLGVREP